MINKNYGTETERDKLTKWMEQKTQNKDMIIWDCLTKTKWQAR